MRIDNLSPVLPVDDMAAAVAWWSAVLGAPPRFVDGDRWAQFDVADRHLALAGTDRMSDLAGVMLKVDDLAEARARIVAAGGAAGPDEDGPHERRFTATAPGGWSVVCYAPKS